jgi:hypothetical protein
MDRPDGQKRLALGLVLPVELRELLKDALVGGLLVGGQAGVVLVEDAVGVGRDEVVIEQVDDLGIGERTRSDGSGAPSAALQRQGVLALGGTAVG